MRISAKLRKEREATPVVEAPKRKRRTNAEIAADELADRESINDSVIKALELEEASSLVNYSKSEEE